MWQSGPCTEFAERTDLLDDLDDPAGADGAATFTDREPQAVVHGDRLDQLHRDVGVVTLPEGTEMVMPGDNVTMSVELIVPIAMEEKLRFAIREGGRTVGAGVVASIQE